MNIELNSIAIVGVPAALLATVTLPLFLLRFGLEMKKLRLEIAKLELDLPQKIVRTIEAPPPGKSLSWFVANWQWLQLWTTLAAVWLGLILSSYMVVFALCFISIAIFFAGQIAHQKHWKKTMNNVQAELRNMQDGIRETQENIDNL